MLAGDRPHLKRIAEQAFQNYIAVLLASLLLLIPMQRPRVVATGLLTLGVVMGLWSVYRVSRALAASDEKQPKMMAAVEEVGAAARLFEVLFPSTQAT